MTHKILVVDVGGTHIKILATGHKTPRKLDSGAKMTARKMCAWIRGAARDWPHDVVAIGYPGPVLHGKPVANPYNLAQGMGGIRFQEGLRLPGQAGQRRRHAGHRKLRGRTHAVSGAGHRARFRHDRGRRAGADGAGPPTRTRTNRTYEDYIGLAGLDRLGKKKWRRHVFDITERRKSAPWRPITWCWAGATRRS